MTDDAAPEPEEVGPEAAQAHLRRWLSDWWGKRNRRASQISLKRQQVGRRAKLAGLTVAGAIKSAAKATAGAPGRAAGA